MKGGYAIAAGPDMRMVVRCRASGASHNFRRSTSWTTEGQLPAQTTQWMRLECGDARMPWCFRLGRFGVESSSRGDEPGLAAGCSQISRSSEGRLGIVTSRAPVAVEEKGRRDSSKLGRARPGSQSTTTPGESCEAAEEEEGELKGRRGACDKRYVELEKTEMAREV